VTTTASTVLQVIIVLAILGLIISKRLKPRPVKEDTRLGMDASGKSAGVASAVIGSSILLMFGLSLLGESVAVAARVGGQLDRAV
jgi:hypothetical protein